MAIKVGVNGCGRIGRNILRAPNIEAAAAGPMKGVLSFTDQPLVSMDFNHDPASSSFEATLAKVLEGTLVKVCAWYDHEWSFSNRMPDMTLACAKAE